MAALLCAAGKPALVPLATISMLRAAEHGLLAWMLARLTRRPRTGALPYLAAGAAVGVIFGSILANLTAHAAALNGRPLAPAMYVETVIRELLSPVGCAPVIYLSQLAGAAFKLVRASSPAQASPSGLPGTVSGSRRDVGIDRQKDSGSQILQSVNRS
jgi:hypothetical protein